MDGLNPKSGLRPQKEADDLSFVMETFDEFHKTIRDLQEEKAVLIESVKQYVSEKEVYTQRMSAHNKELEALQSVAGELQKGLSKNLDLTEKNMTLQKEIDNNSEKASKMTKELHDIKDKHCEEIASIRQDCEKSINDAVKRTQDIERKIHDELKMVIASHEANAVSLQNNCTELIKDKDAEILKLTVEYENKIGKLQMQKNMQASTPQTTSSAQEIFRQKQQHMKAEYENKLASLKRCNEDLLRKISQFEKPDTGSRLSLASKKRRL